MSGDLQRNLVLLVPLLTVVATAVLAALGRLRLPDQAVAGATLGGLLALGGVVAVEAATAWWTFAPAPTAVAGIPAEVAIGWALVWGALPGLLGGRLWIWVAAYAWVDVLLMPRLSPLVELGPRWLLGEAVLLLVVALPATALALLTRRRQWLAVRVVLQVLTFTLLVFVGLPSLVFARADGSWAAVLDHSLPVRSLLLAAGVLAAAPALSAVVELARVGRGTPFPWDPPDRLVLTGPYAYLANPMQVGATLLLLVLAAAARSGMLVAAAAVTVVFSHVLAERQERSALTARWADYEGYRAVVPTWWPRWHPHVPAPGATLWVGEECGVCRATGDAVRRAAPTGLTLHAAEDGGVRLTRMRWVGPGPTVDRGVAALARALEQTVLPVAWVCWLVRLPGVIHLVQVVADACGLGPQSVDGRPTGVVGEDGRR